MFGFGKYKKKYNEANTEKIELEGKISRLSEQLESYQKNYQEVSKERDSIKKKYSDLVEVVGNESPTLNDVFKRKTNLDEECTVLNNKIEFLKRKYIDLNEDIEMQNFGHYETEYSSSDIYDDKLQELRAKQKDMEKSGRACNCKLVFDMNSKKMADAFIKNNTTHILRSFNIECAEIIKGVRYSNYETCINKIDKAFEFYNEKNSLAGIVISSEYKHLKVEELKLIYERARKRQEEKDELRRQRELEREERRVAQELEEKRETLEKEQNLYEKEEIRLKRLLETDLDDIERQLINEKLDTVQKHLEVVNRNIQEVNDREANIRAGWVYIISNIGAFGENVYKIGMTRRLEPQDRIDELSGASVPFRFDTHALIFSEDAPGLEAALHRAFEDEKVNLVNGRKEFFNVSLEEIEKVVHENYDGTVDFKYTPDADQYRESVAIRNNCKK